MTCFHPQDCLSWAFIVESYRITVLQRSNICPQKGHIYPTHTTTTGEHFPKYNLISDIVVKEAFFPICSVIYDGMDLFWELPALPHMWEAESRARTPAALICIIFHATWCQRANRRKSDTNWIWTVWIFTYWSKTPVNKAKKNAEIIPVKNEKIHE